MEHTIFGKTGLKVSRTGFGCIPIQRISFEESTALLRHAYVDGVTLFDTANGYTTSEERIGIALGDMRDKIVLCTKSGANEPGKLMEHIENSLRMLKTDYIDVFQFHNPDFVPKPGDPNGLYDQALLAKKQGKIRHIGITSHNRERAAEAVKSGLYETLQYPLSYISSVEELELIKLCKEHNVGVLAMKGLCGGLLTNAKAAFAFLRQYDNVIPIWGIQHMWELEEFLSCEKDPPEFSSMKDAIERDKEELSGNFCRCCGYCLPCPAGIPIPNAARITFLLRRAAKGKFADQEWQDNMKRIDNCTSCGNCKAHCPYGLDVPALLRRQQKEFFEILKEQSHL